MVKPKSISTEFLLLAVGTFEGDDDVEKIKFLSPAYEVVVLPLASCAAIVTDFVVPAVIAPGVAVITNLVAVPGLTTTLPLVTAVPVAGVKVNVPVPIVPVKINLEVKLATPLTKSPEAFNTAPPLNPVMLPVKVLVTVMLFEEAVKAVTIFP
ncbi:hypothetical protein AQBE111736_13830 [Aquirufa beregesia]